MSNISAAMIHDFSLQADDGGQVTYDAARRQGTLSLLYFYRGSW